MKIKNIAIIGAVLALASSAFAGDSKFTNVTSGTSAAVTFGVQPVSHSQITAVSATSDKSTSVLKLYSSAGGVKFPINAAVTSGAQVVTFANTSSVITTNDVVVIQCANGVTLGTTVASAVSTNGCTLTLGVPQALTTNDVIWQLKQNWQASVGSSAALQVNGYVVFDAPPGPVYAVLDCNTNATLSLTRQP